jgi:cytoskeleton protein RodZ
LSELNLRAEGAMESMESIGNELKAARAKKNVSIERIAEETRINPRYLRSLEDAKYEDLPGGMYNRAFLRAYCEYLGVDPKEMIRRYEAETAPVGDKAPKTKNKAFRPVSYPQPHPMLIWSFVLLATVVGLYFSRGWITTVFSPYFSRPAPQQPAEESKPPQTQALQQPAPQQQKPSLETAPLPASISTMTAPTESGAEADAKEPPPAGKKEPEPVATPQPAPVAAAAEPSPMQSQKALRIGFQAIQECWLSVSSDGRRVFVSVVKPGDHNNFEANERFNIILGNAGGVNLTINGKPAKPLGKSGEVLKIEINTSNLLDWLE